MWQRKSKDRNPRTFDPKDNDQVKHTRVGVWDLYKQKLPEVAQLQGWLWDLESQLGFFNDIPYVWRMIKDVATLKSCWTYLTLYLVIEVFIALLPALSLWWVHRILAGTCRLTILQVLWTIPDNCT